MQMESADVHSEAQSLRDFEMAELAVAASDVDSASLFRDQHHSAASAGPDSLCSSPDRRPMPGSRKDARSPLCTLINRGGAGAAAALAQKPQPASTDGSWSPQQQDTAESSQHGQVASPGHIIARNYTPPGPSAGQAGATPEPLRVPDRHAVTAAGTQQQQQRRREAAPDTAQQRQPQQAASETAEQRASELDERLARQQQDFEQALQRQQAGFQATLREEVDIRVTLQTEALQDENDALRDQLERWGGASPPPLRRSLSAGSLAGMLPSPLPGTPAARGRAGRRPQPQPQAAQSGSQTDGASASSSDDDALTQAPAPAGAGAEGQQQRLTAELATAHRRIMELEIALEDAAAQHGASGAGGHAGSGAAAEELQQLQIALRDAEADTAAAQDVVRGAELDAEDAMQQRAALQAAWDADAQRRQHAAEALQRQLADMRAAVAEAAIDAVAARRQAEADAAAADSDRAAAEAAQEAAEAEACRLAARLQGAEQRLLEAEEADVGFSLPQRNDRLDWVAADIAGSPVAAAAAADSAADAAPGAQGHDDSQAAQRQDASVRELHMQVQRLHGEVAAARRTVAAEAAEQIEDLQVALEAARAAEQAATAAAQAAAARLEQSEHQLVERETAAAAMVTDIEQHAAALQGRMREVEAESATALEQADALAADLAAAEQQWADAEHEADFLQQQLDDGKLEVAALQQRLAEAAHERDAAFAELDAARTAAALTGSAITASAASAQAGAEPLTAQQLQQQLQQPAGGQVPAALFSPGLHSALAAADARLVSSWPASGQSAGSDASLEAWQPGFTPPASAAGSGAATPVFARSSGASFARSSADAPNVTTGSSGGATAPMSAASSGCATPQDSSSVDDDSAAFEPMSEVRRKRLRLTPSKVAGAAGPGAILELEGGDDCSDVMPNDAASSVWSDSEDEASVNGWLGGSAAERSASAASTPAAASPVPEDCTPEASSEGVDCERQHLAAQQAELVDRLEAAAAEAAVGDIGGTAAPLGAALRVALADCRTVAAAEQQGVDQRLAALQQADEADELREELAEARGSIAAERERVAELQAGRAALQQALQAAAPAATADLAQQLAEPERAVLQQALQAMAAAATADVAQQLTEARQELKQARGRVEALLQEKATLEGRLAAMHEADIAPAATAERARLEGALQEAAFLRGRMEAMGAANALQSMQQPQAQLQMQQRVAALEAEAAAARAALAAERRAAGNVGTELQTLRAANEALVAARDTSEARVAALEAVGSELQAQCSALQAVQAATAAAASEAAARAEALRRRVAELETANAGSVAALQRSQRALAAEQLVRAAEQQQRQQQEQLTRAAEQQLRQQQEEQWQRQQERQWQQAEAGASLGSPSAALDDAAQQLSLWAAASDSGLSPAMPGSSCLAAECTMLHEELGRVAAERDELALRLAEAEGLAAAIGAEFSPPDSDAGDASPHRSELDSPQGGTISPAGSAGYFSASGQLAFSPDRGDQQSPRRCLSLTPPVPDSGGRHRSRLPQSAMPPANHSGTPPHLHEHAAVERLSEREAAVQQLAAALAGSQFRCAATAAALAAAESSLAAGTAHGSGSAQSRAGSCSPGTAARVQQPDTPPQAAALSPAAHGRSKVSDTASSGSTAEAARAGGSAGSFEFEFRTAAPPATQHSQDAADVSADLQQRTEDAGANASPQLRQARQQAETLLFTLQREAAAHRAAEEELAAAAEAAAVEADGLRARIGELETALETVQANPQDVAALQQRAEAADRWAAAAQAQADARSAETEEAFAQAAALDGELAAAEAGHRDLSEQVVAIMAEAAELSSAVEAAADALATHRGGIAAALERAEDGADGAEPAAAPPGASATEFATGDGAADASSGALALLGGKIDGGLLQRRSSAASLSSVEAEHLSSGAWLSPCQPQAPADGCGAAAEGSAPAGLAGASTAHDAPLDTHAAPATASSAAAQLRQQAAPCLSLVASARRSSLTTALRARAEEAEEAAEEARRQASAAAAAEARCRGRAAKAARQAVRAQQEAHRVQQDVHTARQEARGARREAARLAARLVDAAADRGELLCQLADAQASVQQLQQAVQRPDAHNVELASRLSSAASSSPALQHAAAAGDADEGAALAAAAARAEQLRAQLALQQGVAQLAVAVALDRVSPGKGNAAAMAARVAAMIAAQPEAAEAAGMRPIWLTLQALSAQDEATDDEAAEVSGLQQRLTLAGGAAAAGAEIAGSSQHERWHSGDLSAEETRALHPAAPAGYASDGGASAESRPEAAGGDRGGGGGAKAGKVSPDHCSSRSDSGSDAFEDLKLMSAVLRHSISRTGSSSGSSSGSLWADSDD